MTDYLSDDENKIVNLFINDSILRAGFKTIDRLKKWNFITIATIYSPFTSTYSPIIKKQCDDLLLEISDDYTNSHTYSSLLYTINHLSLLARENPHLIEHIRYKLV
jgi:hypothetical protein